MTSALDQLAEWAGIQPAYTDIWGRERTASPAAKRALLAAMGIACEDETAAQKSLALWRAARWHQLLPPVLVAPVWPETVRVPLHVQDGEQATLGYWQLHLEGGGFRQGEFHAGDLPVLERGEAAGVSHLALGLDIPQPGEIGYHRLSVQLDGRLTAVIPLILHPATCYQPPAIRDGRRVWGLSTQLYGVRSQRNWGMGDFTDLQAAVAWAGNAGAALVGVNPLHTLYPHNPLHISPYSPSSRQFLNVLYLDIEAVPEFADCAEARAQVADPAFQQRLAELRASELIDYAGVAAAKFPVLELLYRCFRTRHLEAGSPRGLAFRQFQAEQGEELYWLSLFEALQADFHRQDGRVWGWPAWPAAYRDRHAPEVLAWAEDHRERVEFFQYLQWLAAGQLQAVGARSYESSLGVGLYQDLAVGVDRGGAETWMHRDLYAFEASVGAPPDDFNLQGQDWGLPPLIPQRLREAAYAPFIHMLRANMRVAGALRIDHVMGLMRLYWVPPGDKADAGVYVAYPFRDLVGILALESQRNRCLVIGEDLGTVPDEVRAAMRDMGMLAYRLFYFEKHWESDQRFKAPDEIDAHALVAAATHDLPTLVGYWQGEDLKLRERLDLFPSEAMQQSQNEGRTHDRPCLLEALQWQGLWPAGWQPDRLPGMDIELRLAIQRYLARSPSRVLLVQAEDILGEVEQANLPGTVDEHPNWRRRLSLGLEDWAGDARMARISEAMGWEGR